jgi:DNA-binding SARP family transcriptional activator/tetratricopeptide (TPR) repeat protein
MVQDHSDTFRLKLLGRFSIVTGNGDEVTIGAPRQQALVAYLTMQGAAGCTRERLATMLWGETGEANARHSLSQAILALRKRLVFGQEKLLIADRAVLRLTERSLSVDVREFDALIEAGDPASLPRVLALFGADFLDGLNSGAPAFDDWLEGERARLWRAYGSAVEQAAAHRAVPAERVIEGIARLSDRDPFDEALHRLMLRTLAQRFGSAAALDYGDKIRKLLDRELGVEPEPETQALIADIRAIPRMGTPLPIQATLSPPHPPPQTSMPRLFANVPPRDFNFTGRAADLDTLNALLTGPDPKGRIAIHGLGGMGKSTFASEYAYRHADAFAGVWWAPASQRTLLIESLAALAVQLNPGLATGTDQAKAAQAALNLIARSDRPFLLIYDDASSPDVVNDFLPFGQAAAIITSRWPDWAGRAIELKLGGFDEAAAVEFLQKRAGRLDAEGAGRLSRALGQLPLALDHAGAYCRLSASSFDSYRKRIDAAIAHTPRGVSYPASIAATFDLALETAISHDPGAEVLLGSLAFLAPERIPFDLVAGAMDSFGKESALAALFAVSLVDHETDAAGRVLLTLHPLVQAALRVRLTALGQVDSVLRDTARALGHAFPTDAITNPRSWGACMGLLQHVLALRELSTGLAPPDLDTGQFLSGAGRYLHVLGAYDEAGQLHREALAVAERLFPSDSPVLAIRQNDLALLLTMIGRYSEAEPLLRRSIAHDQDGPGRVTLDGAIRLSNLARLLSDTKRYHEAEPLFRKAIETADDPDIGDPAYAVAWRNNLGIVLNETGRNDLGEAVYRAALQIGRERLGPHHYEVGRCMNNLGLLLRDVGKLEESEALIVKGLEVSAAALGPEHPIHARCLENLAKTLLLTDRLDEALETAAKALRVHEAKLGPGHFWTIASAATTGRALEALGRPGEADALRGRFAIVRPALPATGTVR